MLLVATERQIAANRANASKSTGPRSAAGKKRASGNSFRHGLSLRYSDAEITRQLDIRARQIVGETNDNATLELARTVAEAELDIARVRQIKLTLIGQASATEGLQPVSGGTSDPQTYASAKHFRSSMADARWLVQMEKWIDGQRTRRRPKAILFDSDDASQRAVEAAQPVLQELVKLMRYECRAVARRDRAIKAMMLRRSLA
jgi:hypothetical protein